jgi:hypothetical protein
MQQNDDSVCATEPSLECEMLRSHFQEGHRIALGDVSNSHLKKALFCADLVGAAQKMGPVSDNDVGAVNR